MSLVVSDLERWLIAELKPSIIGIQSYRLRGILRRRAYYRTVEQPPHPGVEIR